MGNTNSKLCQIHYCRFSWRCFLALLPEITPTSVATAGQIACQLLHFDILINTSFYWELECHSQTVNQSSCMNMQSALCCLYRATFGRDTSPDRLGQYCIKALSEDKRITDCQVISFPSSLMDSGVVFLDSNLSELLFNRCLYQKYICFVVSKNHLIFLNLIMWFSNSSSFGDSTCFFPSLYFAENVTRTIHFKL